LHDGKNFLYTLKYFPSLKVTFRIVRKKCQQKGEFKLDYPVFKKTIVMVYPDSEPEVMGRVYDKLIKDGYVFKKRPELDSSKHAGATALFMAGKISGVFHENPYVYDGYVAMHYGQARKYRIFQSGPSGKINISKTRVGKYGLYYPGWVLVLKD